VRQTKLATVNFLAKLLLCNIGIQGLFKEFSSLVIEIFNISRMFKYAVWKLPTSKQKKYLQEMLQVQSTVAVTFKIIKSGINFL